MASPTDIAAESGVPMIPEQRRELMKRQLRKHQVLRVHQMMEMFDCSHMTIRRDIALLEQEGRACSFAGGVRIASQLHSELSHQLKAVVELSQKQVMAKLASRLLHANMRIYLDAGTSMLETAPYIRVLSGMTVVTNDFGIVQALIESPMPPWFILAVN
jgi:DeoR/GlpR family transcriptional regulator of sugar metabolism